MKEPGDITKLPKWARTKIEVLEMRLREERERNPIMDAGESNTVLDGRQWADEPDIYLPNGAHITFLFDQHKDITVYNRDGRLDVNSSSGMLAVYPGATNSVEIGVVDR